MALTLLSDLRRSVNMPGERGQSLVEYSLLIALIAVAALAGVVALGGSVGTLYSTFSAIIAAL